MADPRDPRGRKPRLTLHPCPSCGAAAGEPCRSRSGKVLPNGHGARRELAGLPARGDRARKIARLALDGGGDPVAALRRIAGEGDDD